MSTERRDAASGAGTARGPFLVCGSSGPLGSKVVEALASRGAIVRGLVRSEQGARRAKSHGAQETAVADLWNGTAVDRALSGCAGAFYFCPRGKPDEASVGRAFIAACERANVPRIVVLSMIQPEAHIPNHRASLEVEERLGQSPLEHVIMRPGMFMQALPNLAQIGELGWVGRPYPVDTRLTVVDTCDLGEVAAIALTEDHLVNGTFELSAPGMITMAEIARLASEFLGKPIEARQIDLDQWAMEKTEAFASPYTRENYLAMFGHFSKYGFKGGNGFTLSCILGREPTSFRGYLARSATQGRDRI